MSKPILKINFSDFWEGFSKEDNMFTNMLKEKYEVDISENPDLLFYSCYSNDFLKFDCPKIYYTAENTRPDFKECDFALTFDFDHPVDKHYRLPLYRWNGNLEALTLKKNVEDIIASKTKFCCMVVSNGNGTYRNEFYKKLNEYKTVDSGGKYLNNVGGPVADKMEFIKDYKFVLSFENSSYPGYTTEKIIEPMFANSIPVYWGNNRVGEDFNTSSFVNVHQYDNMEEAINAIIAIDKDDTLYRQYVAAPYFRNNIFPPSLEFSNISKALIDAVDRILTQPAVGIAHKGYSERKIKQQKLKSFIKRIGF